MQSKTKLYFIARMLLSNSWKFSSVSSKIFNKESIRCFFKNTTAFYFWLGEKKPTRTNKRQATIEQHVSSVRHRGRKWLPAGTSVIPGYSTKQKTQPYEPDIRAVKAIICAFTASPNLFEVWLPNRHCTNPLVHQGQQLAMQRCCCLCCGPLCLSHPCLEEIPPANKGKECLLCAGLETKWG